MSSLAAQLWQARRAGTVVDPAAIEAPKDLAAAYVIQDEIVALSGAPARGFKVGSTSAEAQRVLGTTEPGAGVMLAPYVHESPARIAIAPAHTPSVEGEFAFLLGADLPPRAAPYTVEEVAAAIAAVAGAIEVVGTRFAGGLGGKGRALVTADCGANIAFVGGAWQREWRTLDLKAHGVTVSINGTARGSGTGSRALGDPLNVMLWLANMQSKLGRGLAAGEVISTGTCTGLDPVTPGDHAQADFGSLGTVDIVFEPL